MNTSAFGVERGTPFRVPATANLVIDSADRSNLSTTSPWDFTINKQSNHIIGFFTRIGVTEVVLDWCVPNISAALGNNTLTVVDISGTATNQTVTVPDNCYTMAQLLNQLVAQLNLVAWPVAGVTWSVSQFGGQVSLACTRSFQLSGTTLTSDLALLPSQIGVSITNLIIPPCADIRPITYLDFVSDTLTSVQDVKDASTNAYVRDILCRWYFEEDTQETYDQYGFPIYMGYKPFARRRVFNPPKQIKWEQNTTLGQLVFQVYDNTGNLLTFNPPSGIRHNQWRMTLQLSEG